MSGDSKLYDLVIIGGGPAGYTAALYGARSGFKVVVVEKLSPGGQMATTNEVDNYPGFPQGVDGFALGEKMQEQAERFGVETLFAEVESVELRENPKRLTTTEGELLAKSVIIATGAYPRELGLAKEPQLRGRGVAYCATCDGRQYKDKVVVVNGGGNSAVEDAAYLAKLCRKVYLVHRRDSLRAAPVYMESLQKSGVEILWNSKIVELLAEQRLQGVRIEDTKSGTQRVIDCDGLFVAIGRVPDSKLFAGQLTMDAAGYLVAGEDTCTSEAGVFAAGDVRTKKLRQIVTAVADGALAAQAAEDYLLTL